MTDRIRTSMKVGQRYSIISLLAVKQLSLRCSIKFENTQHLLFTKSRVTLRVSYKITTLPVHYH